MDYGRRMAIADEVGRAVYKQAGYDPEQPPEGGAVDLALGAFGDNVLRINRGRALQDACLARLGNETHIFVRDGLSGGRTNFAIAEQVAHLWLCGETWFRFEKQADRMGILRDVAAWLVTPPRAFRASMVRLGCRNIRGLANAWHVPQTCAARRIGECDGPPSIVTTPHAVYHGGEWPLTDGVAREIAKLRQPGDTVRRHVIDDEPGRVALLKVG